jgi:hypothetical protein
MTIVTCPVCGTTWVDPMDWGDRCCEQCAAARRDALTRCVVTGGESSPDEDHIDTPPRNDPGLHGVPIADRLDARRRRYKHE